MFVTFFFLYSRHDFFSGVSLRWFIPLRSCVVCVCVSFKIELKLGGVGLLECSLSLSLSLSLCLLQRSILDKVMSITATMLRPTAEPRIMKFRMPLISPNKRTPHRAPTAPGPIERYEAHIR